LEKVIADNMGLVYKQLYKFNLVQDENAFSFAMEGLMSAAKTYNKEKGFAFSTYATSCIYNAIAQYTRSLNKKRKLDVISYDVIVDEEAETTFKDLLPDTKTLEDVVLKQELYTVLMDKFYKCLDAIDNSAHVSVIQVWQESDFTATQTEISNEVGLSQSQVSRVLSTFKYRLRKEMEDYLC
jgi:RNA polymerase sigma factor (sigma-70 family)